MTEWIENCFAYADNKEANRRAKDIRAYNSNEPDGKAKTTVQDRLKKNFDRLYAWGLTDEQIAGRIGISVSSVQQYRLKKKLTKNKKKPAGTGN